MARREIIQTYNIELIFSAILTIFGYFGYCDDLKVGKFFQKYVCEFSTMDTTGISHIFTARSTLHCLYMCSSTDCVAFDVTNQTSGKLCRLRTSALPLPCTTSLSLSLVTLYYEKVDVNINTDITSTDSVDVLTTTTVSDC